jgi:VIT1/CCC1 family predicted Fe2+/Mn2+ transporter
VAFTLGAAVPLLTGALITDPQQRMVAVAAAASVALLLFGALGAYMGGAKKVRGATRVLLGGWGAMAVTYWVGMLIAGEPV